LRHQSPEGDGAHSDASVLPVQENDPPGGQQRIAIRVVIRDLMGRDLTYFSGRLTGCAALSGSSEAGGEEGIRSHIILEIWVFAGENAKHNVYPICKQIYNYGYPRF